MGNVAGIIRSLAIVEKLDPALCVKRCEVESSFNPLAQSGAGAKGLFQLMPATAEELGVMDPLDPVQSITGGLRYMGKADACYKGDSAKADAPSSWDGDKLTALHGTDWKQHLPAETKGYLGRILSLNL